MSYDTDNAILSLGIYWDGSNTLSFYMNKVATGENPGHMKLVKTITKYHKLLYIQPIINELEHSSIVSESKKIINEETKSPHVENI